MQKGPPELVDFSNTNFNNEFEEIQKSLPSIFSAHLSVLMNTEIAATPTKGTNLFKLQQRKFVQNP